MRLFPLTLGFVFLLVGVAFAESDADPRDDDLQYAQMGQELGILDQVVSVNFRPSETYLLVESGLGKVKRLSALAVQHEHGDVNYQGEGGGGKFLAGATVPLGSITGHKGEFHYTFFLVRDDATFAATPVIGAGENDLQERGLQSASYAETNGELREQLQQKETAVAAAHEEGSELRARASSIAGVDEIIDLRMKLTQIKAFGQDNAVELKRLEDLVKLGRDREDPPGVYRKVKQLSVHLTDAAKVTAMADRLENSRREAARASVNRKMGMIKQMRGVDSERLAKQILELRRKRRQLEARLRETPVDDEEDQF